MKVFSKINLLSPFIVLILCVLSQIGVAQEKKAWLMVDSIALGDTVMANLSSLTNASGKTTQMTIDVYPGDSPIEIKKVVWERLDTVWNTLEPISMKLGNRGLSGQKIFWRINLDFDYTQSFASTYRLLVYTDKGVFTSYTSENGKLKNNINLLTNEKNDLTVQLNDVKKETRTYFNLWIVFLVLSSTFFILVIGIIFKYRLVKKRFKVQLEDCCHKIGELSLSNEHLESQNADLYRNRFDSINKLLEDYYDKKDSDNLKELFYNALKNYVLSFKDKKKLEEIQTEVDSLQDNLMTRIKEQIPNFSSEDLILLTYILGGFSAKAISVFTDINIKQFYYRRQKLIQKILDSDSPDKEFFASKI